MRFYLRSDYCNGSERKFYRPPFFAVSAFRVERNCCFCSDDDDKCAWVVKARQSPPVWHLSAEFKMLASERKKEKPNHWKTIHICSPVLLGSVTLDMLHLIHRQKISSKAEGRKRRKVFEGLLCLSITSRDLQVIHVLTHHTL